MTSSYFFKIHNKPSYRAETKSIKLIQSSHHTTWPLYSTATNDGNNNDIDANFNLERMHGHNYIYVHNAPLPAHNTPFNSGPD